jgi:hypothetical protein
MQYYLFFRCYPCHPLLDRIIQNIHASFLKKELEENEETVKKKSVSNSEEIMSKMKLLGNFNDVLSFLSVEETVAMTRASGK